MTGGVVLRGERVTLRPLREDELDAMLDGLRAVGGPFEPNRARLASLIRRSGRVADGRLALAVEVDERLVGDISARAPARAFPPGVWEIGIDLYRGDDRGRGYGGEAVALLTQHLFEAEGAARVQASTSVSNAAMRGVLERLGFAEEGVMRSFMPLPDGGRDDYVLYARTEPLRPAAV